MHSLFSFLQYVETDSFKEFHDETSEKGFFSGGISHVLRIAVRRDRFQDD